MQEKENFLEIEKKFELTPEEYKKISTQLTKAIHEKIEDIYYDTPVYDLTKKWQHCRLRNGELELKVEVGDISSQEIYGENAKQKLTELGFPFETLQKAYSIETNREKYTWVYQWYNFVLDIIIIMVMLIMVVRN